MATFTKRGIRWRVQVRRGEFYEQKTFAKRADGEKWARDIETSIDKGTHEDRQQADSISLGDALKRYSESVTPGKKSARQEFSRIKRWRRDPLALIALGQVKPADIAAWRDQRLAAGTSPTTVRTDLALISHIYTVARREWSIPVQNPVKDTRLPAPARGRERRLEPGEETRLLEACRADPDGKGKAVATTPWLEAAVRLAIATAMRQGELVSLLWADVDWINRTAFLRDTKNGSVSRVPLSRDAIVTLLAIKITDDPRVLPTSGPAIGQAFEHARLRAKIEGLRFHDLRHEATARLFERSDLRDLEIQMITGHKTASMMRRYANLRAIDLAARLD